MDIEELRRHRKIVYLGINFLRLWINGDLIKYDHIRIPVIKGAKDSYIADVFWNPDRSAFGVVLFREDFPEIEDGVMAPEFIGEYEVREVKI